jgi:hypothetical protein
MRNRLNKTDRRILSGALLLLLLMSYLMYDDSLLFSDGGSASLKTIGHIETTQFDVRRKISKQFTWKSARNDDTIHQGDALFTGENSKAIIRLNDGRTLTLSENSMIVFDNLGDQLNLDLRFGKLGGTLSGCVKVNAGGKNVDLCGKNEKVEIDSDGSVQTDRKPASEAITWAEPPPSTVLHDERNTPLALSWSSKAHFHRFRMEISSSADFKNVISGESTLKKTISSHEYPSEGTYFVRIRGEDARGRSTGFSEPTKIFFHEVAAPEITSPENHFARVFKTDPDGSLLETNRLKVAWTFQLPTSPFDLEIAKNPDFKNADIVPHVTGLSTVTPALKPGKYYVRVRDSELMYDTHQPWSNEVAFSVSFSEPFKLQAPELFTKLIQHVVPSDTEPVISWKPVEQAQKYLVQASRTPDFKSKTTYQTKDAHLTLRDYPAGPSYFRVAAATDKGTVGPVSETGELHVSGKKPVLSPLAPIVVLGKTKDDPGDPQKFKLSWSDNRLAKSYVVQVSKDPKFETPRQFVSRKPASEVVVKHPGEVYWRVRPLDSEGHPLSPFSDNGDMSYILKVPLSDPVLAEPANDITLYYQKREAAYVWLEWNPVKEATSYIIEVALDQNFQQKVMTAQSPDPHYLVKENLPSGKLYWRVRAAGDFQRMSWWSEPRQMYIYSGRAPAGGYDGR